MDTMQDIWTELGDRVRNFVGRRVNDAHAADDIAQDVMLKVQAQLDGDARPADEKLPAWVFAIARNAVIDHYRSRSVRRDHADVDAVDVTDADETDRHDAIGALTPCLLRMVEMLPEPYRTAMRLADFDGLPQQEIADRMGISLSGAKSRVQRARQQLREMMLDCCHIERDVRGNVMDHEPTERSKHYCGTDDDGSPLCGQ